MVQDARFLPFDTPSFLFDTQSNPFLEPTQREAFRQQNSIVKSAANTASNTITRDTIQNLIDGWYSWCGGISTVNCYIDDKPPHAFVPSADCSQTPAPTTCGWTNAPLPYDPSSFYQTVPRTYCRTCHVAVSNKFNVQSFKEVNANWRRIGYYLFTTSFMPYAEVPYQRFWSDISSQNQLRVLSGRSVPPSPTLTLVPPAGTEDNNPDRKITVFAKDKLTGESLRGSVYINGKTGPTGVEISYPGCSAVVGKKHELVSCPGSVTVADYPVAKFTD